MKIDIRENMEILEIANSPELARHRYMPEIRNEVKRRKYTVCDVCKTDGELVKCSNLRKYYHRWCVEPFCFSSFGWDSTEYVDLDLNKKLELDSEEIDDDLINCTISDEPLNMAFDGKVVLSFLENVQEDKESSEEDTINNKSRGRSKNKTRKPRKPRDVSPIRDLDISQVSGPRSSRLASRRATASKADNNSMKQKFKINTVKPSSEDIVKTNRSWFGDMVKAEHDLLTTQFEQFLDFVNTSSYMRTNMGGFLFEKNPSLPVTDESNDFEQLLNRMLSNFESLDLEKLKNGFDSNMFNEMDHSVMQFLTWQRVNQLILLQKIYRNKPNGFEGVYVSNRESSNNISQSNVPLEQYQSYSYKRPMVIVPEPYVHQNMPLNMSGFQNSYQPQVPPKLQQCVMRPVETLDFQQMPPFLSFSPMNIQPTFETTVIPSDNSSSSRNETKKRSFYQIDSESAEISNSKKVNREPSPGSINNLPEAKSQPTNQNTLDTLNDKNDDSLKPMPIALLEGRDQKGHPFSCPVLKVPFSIGRKIQELNMDLSQYTNLRTISHFHAKIIYNAPTEKFYLICLGRNGTRVDNVLYKPNSPEFNNSAELKDGSEIEIGKVEMTFKLMHAQQCKN